VGREINPTLIIDEAENTSAFESAKLYSPFSAQMKCECGRSESYLW